jgi:hypothetical protein
MKLTLILLLALAGCDSPLKTTVRADDGLTKLERVVHVMVLQSQAQSDAIAEATQMIVELCEDNPRSCVKVMNRHKARLDAALERIKSAGDQP